MRQRVILLASVIQLRVPTMMLFAVSTVLLGLAASAHGASMQVRTAQFPGNPRIRIGMVMSMLGGVCVSIGGVSLLMSI
jgi:hypothetical protein